MVSKNKYHRFLPVILLALGLILMSVAVVWFVFIRADNNPDKDLDFIEGRIPFPEIPRISLQDAKAAYDLGSAIWVDVRSSSNYKESHIPGAISLPEDEILERLNELSTSDWIIPYCT